LVLDGAASAKTAELTLAVVAKGIIYQVMAFLCSPEKPHFFA
jgi:hypothetical protein